jgi:hypothetical protein
MRAKLGSERVMRESGNEGRGKDEGEQDEKFSLGERGKDSSLLC